MILQIDWTEPDPELRERFRAFVESRRPDDVRPWDYRGQKGPGRQKTNELRYLSARRLLRHYKTISDAAAFTKKETGEKLYWRDQERKDNVKKASAIVEGLEKIVSEKMEKLKEVLMPKIST